MKRYYIYVNSRPPYLVFLSKYYPPPFPRTLLPLPPPAYHPIPLGSSLSEEWYKEGEGGEFGGKGEDNIYLKNEVGGSGVHIYIITFQSFLSPSCPLPWNHAQTVSNEQSPSKLSKIYIGTNQTLFSFPIAKIPSHFFFCPPPPSVLSIVIYYAIYYIILRHSHCSCPPPLPTTKIMNGGGCWGGEGITKHG